MNENKHIKRFSKKIAYSILAIVIVSCVIILSPNNKGTDWLRVLSELLRLVPLFLLLIINHVLLFRLLQQKEYIKYFSACIPLIAFVGFLSSLHLISLKALGINLPPNLLPKMDAMWFLNKTFNYSIVAILILGFDNAINMYFKWIEELERNNNLESENLKNELSVLRNQTSPHFLMNTLNNIHALIDYDKELAKGTVIKLSKLLRVILYESETEHYTFQKEITFISDYLELMKIRVHNQVDVDFSFPKHFNDFKLPPFLFINFIENAFKHGIILTGKSYININFTIDGNYLCFSVANSRSELGDEHISNTSIGITNSKRRLTLLYNNSYQLNIKESQHEFEVTLKIPI